MPPCPPSAAPPPASSRAPSRSPRPALGALPPRSTEIDPPISLSLRRPLAAVSFADLQPSRPHVLRLRPNQMVLTMLLNHVRAPTGHTATRKRCHERPRLEPHRLQHERRVELDVGPQVATWLHFVEHLQNRLLRCPCQREEFLVLHRARG